MHPLKRLGLALAFALAVVAGGELPTAPAQKPEPEPPADIEEASPAIDPAKAAGDRKLADLAARYQAKSTNNLKQIGLAVYNFHDANRRLPEDILDAAGKPLLSWRVLLLPYVEEDKLFREFRLNEPWDSKHNRALLEKVPDVYRSPRVTLKGKGHTVYQVFTGPNAVFGRGPGRGVARIPGSLPDGTANTIMVVESSSAVPWTKPGGIPFDRKKAVPDFGKAFGKRPLAVLFDGSVRVLDLTRIRPETLKNAIDPADGNPLGPDW